jgi:hypothetical protein
MPLGCHRFSASGVRSSMPRFAAVLVLVALVGVGCESSQVAGNATITISGRVLRADGSPAGAVAVGLEREPTVGDVVAGALIVPLTLFTACLADRPPALCRDRNVRRTTTAADGTYRLQVSGDDTQTGFGNARTLSLTAELPPGAGEVGGAAVTAGFKVQTENLVLKDLQLWQPGVTVAPGRIGWDALAGAGGYQVGVEDAGGHRVWSFDSPGREVAFDPRILEDTAGSLAVSTRSQTTAEGTTVSVLRRSGRVAYRSVAGPPASRGMPCTRGTVALAPCPVTDGDFTTVLPPQPALPASTTTTAAPAAGPTESVTVDLGRSRDVSLVVVRGCSCQVEGSVDGKTWTQLGRSSGDTAVVPGRTGAARYVRVTGALNDLREVSAWDAATAAPAR